MMSSHPLEKLWGKRINDYALHLGEVTQLRLSGWKEFTLYLKNVNGLLSQNPVIRGIFSRGGKDGVKPWMDVVYSEKVSFSTKPGSEEYICMCSGTMDRKLFHILGELIPPGGHLMVSYEEGEDIHRDTVRSLNMGIPPVVTPLGLLIFLSGFQYMKDWYFAEGGFEGPRKLWGEKALNEVTARTFYEKTTQQVQKFLKREASSAQKELEVAARERAKVIVGVIEEQLVRSLLKGN